MQRPGHTSALPWGNASPPERLQKRRASAKSIGPLFMPYSLNCREDVFSAVAPSSQPSLQCVRCSGGEHGKGAGHGGTARLGQRSNPPRCRSWNPRRGPGCSSSGPLFLSSQFPRMKDVGNSVNSARSRSYAGGYGPVGLGPIGPGLGEFPRRPLLRFSVNRGELVP
jgi:hypothetical protein